MIRLKELRDKGKGVGKGKNRQGEQTRKGRKGDGDKVSKHSEDKEEWAGINSESFWHWWGKKLKNTSPLKKNSLPINWWNNIWTEHCVKYKYFTQWHWLLKDLPVIHNSHNETHRSHHPYTHRLLIRTESVHVQKTNFLSVPFFVLQEHPFIQQEQKLQQKKRIQLNSTFPVLSCEAEKGKGKERKGGQG